MVYRIIIAIIIFIPQIVHYDQAVTFAVIGDFGNGGVGPSIQVANLINNYNSEFIVTVGDNDYGYGYENSVGNIYNKWLPDDFYPSLGNHDWPNLQEYRKYFNVHTFYHIKRGTIDLFILNSNNSLEYQRNWLNWIVPQTNGRWKIVVLHHPPYSSGRAYGNRLDLQWNYSELGIDLVLAGHSHHYERLYVDSVDYYIVGTGGVGLYEISTPVNGSILRYNANYGVLFIEATPHKLTTKFINVDNIVIDTKVR